MANPNRKIEVTLGKSVRLQHRRDVLAAAVTIRRAALAFDPEIREAAMQVAGVLGGADLDVIEAEIREDVELAASKAD